METGEEKLKYKKYYFYAFIIAIFLTVISWLMVSSVSPIHGLLVNNPALSNFFGYAIFPAYLLGAAVSGNIHQPNEFATWLVVLAQWFVVGYLMVRLINKLNKLRR